MSVLTVAEDIAIQDQFQELLHIASSSIHSEADRNMIRKAFDLAHEAHSNMRRKSGEPYIIHPVCVARIVVEEIGLGATSITASLLHDVVEDTDYTLEFIRKQFGPKVAMIVDGLTKISDVFDNNSSLQAENFRKMLLTISDDMRVILIKLADRLHNMRTLDALSPEKQIKIAGETIYLYAPMAHRLGLYSIKQELEDLSLKYRHPKIYSDIVHLLKDSEEKRNKTLEEFIVPLREKLLENDYQFEITGRVKSIYSIYYKMQHKGVPFEEIYDLSAVRIVFDPDPGVPEKKQCWNIYSLITDLYTPKHDRIRDWVSMPKANGYEALHITVMGNEGKWVEVQIRTRRMDDIAEKGFAAHWKYKGVASAESELDKFLRKVRESLKEPNANAMEFIDDFKMNLFSSEIHIFTPKGQIKTLPQKAIALDFAYDIHSEIGNRAIAAKVNHKLLPLNHELHSGDQVEIITSDRKRTQREWLEDVVTAKAKTSIKNNIKAENKNRLERGKAILEEELGKNNVTPNSRVMRKILDAYDVQTKDELYSKIGIGLLSLEDLPKILKKNTKNKWIRYWQLQLFGPKAKPTVKEVQSSGNFPADSSLPSVVLKEDVDESKLNYRIAKCCNPIPGDDVIGYLRPGADLVLIHKSRCPNAVKILSNRGNLIVPVKWTTYKILSFLARIAVQGIDRPDIYLQITAKITEELNVNIRTFNMSSHDGIFEGTMELYVHDTADLENLMKQLKNLKGMESVKRLEILDQSKEEIT
jgi:GTP pyrophosphokinase